MQKPLSPRWLHPKTTSTSSLVTKTFCRNLKTYGAPCKTGLALVTDNLSFIRAIARCVSIAIPSPQEFTEEQESEQANMTHYGNRYTMDMCKIRIPYVAQLQQFPLWIRLVARRQDSQSDTATLGGRNHVLLVFESPAPSRVYAYSQWYLLSGVCWMTEWHLEAKWALSNEVSYRYSC